MPPVQNTSHISSSKLTLETVQANSRSEFCITGRFNIPAGSLSRSLSTGRSSEFFTKNFRSPRNHGWLNHAGVVMSIRH